jgi:hypothetical protein
VPGGLQRDGIIQLLDAKVAFEGECWPGGKAGKGTRYLGHEPTLATGHTDVFPLLVGSAPGVSHVTETGLSEAVVGHGTERSGHRAKPADVGVIHRATGPFERGFT